MIILNKMADRYGDKREFQRRMDEFVKQRTGKSDEVEDNVTGVRGSAKGDKCSANAKKVWKIPKGYSAKEFDKDTWEYWEKHNPKKFCDSDGRKVFILQEVDKKEDEPKH